VNYLHKAISIAVEGHGTDLDKAGVLYILHPLRVMMAVAGETEKIVAVLHDVVEDTDWTIEKIAEAGFPAAVVEALDALTKREGEEYFAYVARAAVNPIARAVKIADLADNMDLTRLPVVTERDLTRTEKYRKAVELMEKMK
jgi:GTP diphosphokinase / guanosine-3',5'-bis(diphosphate) 3'-diphosphatase